MAAPDRHRAKGSLRDRMIRRLAKVSVSEAEAAGQSVAARLSRRRSWPDLEVIALFASLPGEVETGPVIEICWRAGKRVLLPRVLETGGLEFATCAPGEPLVLGSFGVREPCEDAIVTPISEADQVLVPGVAFDRRGGRLGRGRGYYDRALAGLQGRTSRPLLTGVGFAFQVVEDVPVTPLDVHLDEILTEADWSAASRPSSD